MLLWMQPPFGFKEMFHPDNGLVPGRRWDGPEGLAFMLFTWPTFGGQI
jgi:hypothetical protein